MYFASSVGAKIRRLAVLLSLRLPPQIHRIGSNAIRYRFAPLGVHVRIEVYAVLFALAAAPAFYLGLNNIGVFYSPDETARYMAAQMFAENGKLYIQDALTELDPDSPTGPRGFTQHNGRSVPIHSLGFVFIIGITHKWFGGFAPIVLAAIPGTLIVSLAHLMRMIRPKAPTYLGFAFLGIVPLWYWASRVYTDLGLTFLFAIVTVLCFAHAYKRQSTFWLFLASSALALASLMRHPEAPLFLIIGLAFAVAFIHRLAPFRWDLALRVIGIYAAAQVLLFLLPMALLNWWTYGSPVIIGYSIFYANQFPERLPAESNWFLAPILFVKLAFFPQPIDIGTMWRGLWYQTILMIPMITVFGIIGIFLARRRLLRIFTRAGFSLVILAVIYVVVSRSDPGAFAAAATEPDLRASLTRYWLPIYIALGIGATYTLSYIPRSVSLAVVISIVALSTYHVWIAGPQTVLPLQEGIEANNVRYSRILQEYTEPDSLVIVNNFADKWVAPVRRTIGIWFASGTDENLMRSIADTANAMHQQGRPVYFLFDSTQEDRDISVVAQRLSLNSLDVELVATPISGMKLWKLVAMPHANKTKALFAGNHARTVAPASQFTIAIERGDSRINRIKNPSFERGLQEWNGPDVGRRVRRTARNLSLEGTQWPWN